MKDQTVWLKKIVKISIQIEKNRFCVQFQLVLMTFILHFFLYEAITFDMMLAVLNF